MGFERHAGRCELSRWFKISHLFDEMCSYVIYLFFLSEHRQQNEVEGGRLFHFIFILFIFYLSLSFPGLRITRIFWSLEICSNPCSVLTRKSLNTITIEKKMPFWTKVSLNFIWCCRVICLSGMMAVLENKISLCC